MVDLNFILLYSDGMKCWTNPSCNLSANDATLKRTIAPSDVFNALSELELDSFRGRLEQELEAYTEIKAGKRKPKKADDNGSTQDALGEGATQGDGDVDMVDNPAKKVKRDEDVEVAVGPPAGDDGDETQEEDVEEEEEEEEESEDDEEEEHAPREDDLEHVEDLDREPGAKKGPYDPDAEETDEDEDGPGGQLRDDLGLG
jgi:DNA polymerase epsilon subunit 3